MKKLIFCLSVSALLSMHDSNGMQRIARSLRPMAPTIARHLYTLTTPHWPDHTGEQKQKLTQLTVARLNKEFPTKSSDHPVRDERVLRIFINQVAKEFCPGPAEYSTGHLDHQCLRCGPARRGALHEVKAAFR
ncbi:MAG: hypothetical protein ACHQVS_04300 [Candidatus Babeliales bacterium]